MKKKEAIEIITQVLAIYKGTLQEHQSLQQALNVIKGLKEEEKVEEIKQ